LESGGIQEYGMKRNFFIRTFGCQMNERDSERMAGFLLDLGLDQAKSEEFANLIVINTCTVRRKPEQKVMSLLGRLSKQKKKNPGLILAVAGCVAQQEGARLLERIPHLDMVIGTHAFSRMPELLAEVESGRRIAATEWLSDDDPLLFLTPRPRARNKPSAFVTIMQGCDNFCSFCVVPYVRGRERSRPADEILAEVEGLVADGVKEVTLLGQNVNSYGKKNGAGLLFPGLLREVAKVPGLERVRFTTSHPKDLSDDLIAVMAEQDKIMEHFHLPVQAGSTRVLGVMRRNYTRERYLDLVARLRGAMPEVSITTDLIVGFPGETEDEFQDTLNIMDEVQYDEAFSFGFSPRPYTKASLFPDPVPDPVIKDRLYRLQEKQNQLTLARNQAEVGKVHEVLVEGASKTDPAKLTGRTRTNRLLHFPAPEGKDLTGRLVKVRVTRGLNHSLAGEWISG
jgi:tRNA-2-methylthio-N6-dimethylallyladenosine synthase